jgi:hypothetical protein
VGVEAPAVIGGDEPVDRPFGDLADPVVAVAPQRPAAARCVAVELDELDAGRERRVHPDGHGCRRVFDHRSPPPSAG